MRIMLVLYFCLGFVFVRQGVLAENPNSPPSTEEMDLTDQERHRSQTYVNEALGNKIVKEECAKLEDPRACQGRGGGFKMLGVDSTMISVVGKAYATVMGGMYKGGLELSEEAAKEAEEKNKDDYCVLIGAGAEAVGLAMQQLSGKTISAPTGGATEQKKALYKAARSHRDRAKTATIQAAGWGGTSACYGYMMTYGGASIKSKTNILKMAAAGLLTAFYFKERGAQNKYSDQVKGIADKLPNPGDCNPVTETDCYCSLKANRNDPEHCVPYLHKKKLSSGSILRVACVNDRLKADPNCQCAATDSCLDKTLKNEFVTSGGGSGFVRAPIGKEVTSLVRGELRGGSLSSSALGKNAGVNAFFRKYKDKIPPVTSLDAAGERKASRLAEDFGLSAGLARHLLAAPNPPGLSAAMAKFSGASSGKEGAGADNIPSRKGSGQVVRFQGGDGLKGRRRRKDSSSGFDFNKYLKAKRKKNSPKRGRILEFNRRAVSSAGLDKNPEKNIFRIISKRYMLWEGQR